MANISRGFRGGRRRGISISYARSNLVHAPISNTKYFRGHFIGRFRAHCVSRCMSILEGSLRERETERKRERESERERESGASV